MLLEKFEAILNELSTKITGLHADRYKGEFERDEEWNPAYPCALVRFDAHDPAGRNMKGETVRETINATIYIADRDAEKPSVLNTVEAVENLFNSTDIKFTIGEGDDAVNEFMKCKLSDGGAKLFGYSTQVEIYQLQIQIS